MKEMKRLTNKVKAFINKLQTPEERQVAFKNVEEDTKAGTPRLFCRLCNLVSQSGHVCSNLEVKIPTDKAAWLGDALLELDIRVLISKRHTQAEMGAEAVKYTSGDGQKEYLQKLGIDLPGRNVKSYATVFEQRYAGKFRETYLTALFGAGAVDEIAEVVKGMKQSAS